MSLQNMPLRTCLGLTIPLGMLGQVKPDFSGDGYADLAIGGPYENVGGASDAGAVNVIYGSADGLTLRGNQFWSQDSAILGPMTTWRSGNRLRKSLE